MYWSCSLTFLPLQQIGMVAINDSIMLECCIYRILKKHFGADPAYAQLLDLFHEVCAPGISESWFVNCLHIHAKIGSNCLAAVRKTPFCKIGCLHLSYNIGHVFLSRLIFCMYLLGVTPRAGEQPAGNLLRCGWYAVFCRYAPMAFIGDCTRKAWGSSF